MRISRLLPFAAGATLFILGILYFAVPNEFLLSDISSVMPKSLHHLPIYHNDTIAEQVVESNEINDTPPPNLLWQRRAESVKEAFMHAYRGYMQYAEGWDELLPVSNGKTNK